MSRMGERESGLVKTVKGKKWFQVFVDGKKETMILGRQNGSGPLYLGETVSGKLGYFSEDKTKKLLREQYNTQDVEIRPLGYTPLGIKEKSQNHTQPDQYKVGMEREQERSLFNWRVI